jgi:hypothetical protein
MLPLNHKRAQALYLCSKKIGNKNIVDSPFFIENLKLIIIWHSSSDFSRTPGWEPTAINFFLLNSDFNFSKFLFQCKIWHSFLIIIHVSKSKKQLFSEIKCDVRGGVQKSEKKVTYYMNGSLPGCYEKLGGNTIK